MTLIDELKSRLINSIDLTRNLSDQDVYEIITKMVIDEYQDKRLSLKEKMRISGNYIILFEGWISCRTFWKMMILQKS